MRPRFARRRLSLTSLIDVIFLLLMFFMLATSFTHTTDLPLTGVAAGGTGAADPARGFLALGPEALSLNGVALTLSELPARLGAPGAPRQLLVALRPGVEAQRLADLLATLAPLPGLGVQVLE